MRHGRVSVGRRLLISEGNSYALRHWSGRYLLRLAHWDVDAAQCHLHSMPRYFYQLVPNAMQASRWDNRLPIGRLIGEPCWDVDQFEVVLAPVCACCGDSEPQRHANGFWSPYRCWAHADKNPCAIEGCTRTRGAKGRLDNSIWLCREHWRTFCPPRSLRRRTFLSFFRKARKMGFKDNDRWPDELEERYWEFWRRLIANARHKAKGGNLDLAQIERLFGV